MQSFRFAIAALALCAATSYATPVTDMRAEDLLFMAPDLKKSLSLNPNQDRLWLQVEGKTRSLLQERRSRRERLNVRTREASEQANADLRELVPALDAESAATAAEEKQLRALWLDMYDALDDAQRAKVAVLLNEQLMKVQGDGKPHQQPHEGGDKPHNGRNGGGMRRNG